ncbi:hypothetical protein EVAR_93603_1 [Eumeta japonica]|uniref:Uncharacterized protein n=1 Tax=Eumeta variegata TaxID=151549 RepID=A0A4C1TQH1_EUMVA|nr:hypothetical protein EVAR_93603_1 [Eumeta japonica]
MSENSIDIALVQETYLKPNRPKACSIAGYVQLRTDRTYSSALPTTSGQWSRRASGGSGILGSPEVSARYSRIDKSKNAALRRERISHSRVQIQARALQREVKARVREFRNESWSDLMEEIKPSHKAFWAVTKALKTEDIPLYPHSKPDNSVAIDDAEIAECLADSIETQCSHASLRTTSLISVASRKRFSKNSNPKTIWLPSHSAKSKR